MAAVSIFNDSVPPAHHPLRAVSYCGSCSGRGKNSCIIKSGCYWSGGSCKGVATCNDDYSYYNTPNEPKCYSAECSGEPTYDPCGPAFENSTDKSFSDCLNAVPDGMPLTICRYETDWTTIGQTNFTGTCSVSTSACRYDIGSSDGEAACVDLGCTWTPEYCEETSNAATNSKSSIVGPLFFSAIAIVFVAFYN